jgi:hypothetical protein
MDWLAGSAATRADLNAKGLACRNRHSRTRESAGIVAAHRALQNCGGAIHKHSKGIVEFGIVLGVHEKVV